MKSRGLTISRVRAAISDGAYHYALKYIIDGIFDWVRDFRKTRNVIYGCAEFDALCIEVGRRIAQLPEIDMPLPVRPADERPLDLYLATMIYTSGGHTPVIGDFVQASAGRHSALILTGLMHDELDLYEQKYRRVHIPWENIFTVYDADYLCQTRRLIQLIKHLRPDRLFLFNHHFDAVIVAAAQPEYARKTFYYHHCDHNPALGLYIPHAVHLDLSPHAYRRCRNLLGIDAAFVPLAIKDRGCRDVLSLGLQESLVTCSSGGSSKYDPAYRYAYHTVVPKILAETGGYHVHIGVLDEGVLAKLRQGLAQEGVAAQRFIYQPWEPSIWDAMDKYQVDLYLNSFPQRGSRAAVEVMGSGTPVLWHAAGSDGAAIENQLKYPESPLWATPAQLSDILSSATPDWLRRQGRAARAFFERIHHTANLERGMAEDFAHNPPPPAVEGANYKLDYDRLLGLVHRLNDEQENLLRELAEARRS